MLYLFVFITAMALSMALIPSLTRLAQRYSLVDIPNERKVNVCVVPRVGGIAMIIGATLPILLWVPLESTYVALLLAIAVILLFGVWDDRKDLDYRLKFFGQLIAVLIVVLPGGVVLERIPFNGFDPLPGYVAIPLTIVALLGITNAINLSDGLDGLAGGVSFLSLCGVALLAYIAGSHALTLITLAVMGGTLGFLRYNTWPAQLFMGDAGSQFLGFTLGVLVILLIQDAHSAVSPAVALLILGFPLLDTLTVMTQRIGEGRSPFAPDRNHMHHKLLDLRFDHYEAVFLIYIAQAGLVMAAYLLRYESDVLLVGIYGVFCSFVLGVFYLAKLKDWSLAREKKRARRSLLGRWVSYLRRTGYLQRSIYIVISLLLSLFLLSVACLASEVPADFSVMAGILFFVLVATLVYSGSRLGLLQQVAIYGTSIFMVYLLTVYPGSFFENNARWIDGYFILLAGLVIVAIRFSWNKVFTPTPLDFLVVFLALVVPNLPDTQFQQLGMTVAKIIVLFYAVEFVLRMSDKNRTTLNYATLGTLALVVVRGII